MMKKQVPINLEKIGELIDAYCSKKSQTILSRSALELEFPAKTAIFEEAKPTYFIKYIKKGNVKIVTQYAGMERIIRLANEGKIVGHRGLGGVNTYSVSAIALTDTTVIAFPRKQFEAALKENAHFCFYFMLFFAEELKRSEYHIKVLSNLPVLHRVAYALKMNMESFGFCTTPKEKNILSFTLSRKDIASLAITTYESVIRSLAILEDQKIITLEGKRIRILSANKLVKMAL